MLGGPSLFTLPAETGELTSIPAAQTRATVVVFWKPDCERCGEGLRALASNADGWKAGGIELVLVAVVADEESPERARAALKGWGIARPVLLDRGGGVQRLLRIDKTPATFVLDGIGTLRWAAPEAVGAREVGLVARQVADRS